YSRRSRKEEEKKLQKVVKTHLRDMIIVPEMIRSIVGPEMVGHYLDEFAITCKPVKHGGPGIGAKHSSIFIPLK
ncbi:unnamed protein product, partial [Candidula unifasciata]